MVHVFIVDERTFKIHLEYMFAGTGASDKECTFLSVANTNEIHWKTEENLVGMIADISRIREGDKILFYLQMRKEHEGMFFGVFEATTSAFFDENDTGNYLSDDLGKGLSFRIQIKPDRVYPIGVTEHKCLDSLHNKTHPYQLCWSLIYRKLKGNRGCTMITDYEYNDLLSQLAAKNNNKIIKTIQLSFDSEKDEIIAKKDFNKYKGKQDNLKIFPRLLYKSLNNYAFEVHLQAYIMQNFDISPLKELLLPLPYEIHTWIGNEVSCGVGMQRIDILVKQEDKQNIYLKIVELKCCEPTKKIITDQIPWYIEWVCDYVVPNYLPSGKKVKIIPSIIAKKSTNSDFINTAKSYKCAVSLNDTIVKPIEYIGFTTDDDIHFEKIL